MTKKRFGLIGYPLGHSFSAGYFAEKFNRLQIEAEYLNFLIKNEDELKLFFRNVSKINGLNVTVPWKEKVMTYCQIWSPEAKLIGAVNCISLSASGELVGHNTDWIGFTQSISGLLQGNTVQRALVLGTGGSSKAVQFSLQRLGIEVSFASESKQEWSYSKLVGKMSQFQLVVQTTPLGMFPETNACPSIPYSELHEGHICVDLIYNPEQTLFLKEAAKQGATIKNGLDMLEYQAEESWRIWNSANEALI